MRARSLLLTVLLVAPALAFIPPASAASAEVVGTLPLPAVASGGRPDGIVGAAAVYYKGHSYVFGGRQANGYYSPIIWDYDHASGVAREAARFPTEAGAIDPGRQSGAAVVIGDTIYYFGGAVLVKAQLHPPPADPSTVPRSTASIIAFKPEQPLGPDNPKKVGDLPKPLWGPAAVAHGGVAYVFGGFTFDVANPGDIARRDIVVRFHPTGSPLGGPLVTTLPTKLPFGIQDASAVTLGNSAYIFGGLGNHHETSNPCPDNGAGNHTTVCATDTIIAFTLGTEQSRGVVARLPYREHFAGAAVVNGKAYVLGGQLQSNAPTNKIVEFNPSATTPIRALVPTLPRPFFAAGTSTDGSAIYMFGGRGNLIDLSANVTRVDPGPTPAWPPRNFLARSATGQVNLVWDPPAYDGDSPIGSYRIYRQEDGGTETFIAESVPLNYADTTAKPGVTYLYRVAAVNERGEGASARASTLAGTEPPGPVASLQAFAGNAEVLLRWAPPANTGGSNLTGYRVYREGVELPLFNLAGTVTEARDRDLQNGLTYTYTVRAVNTKGEGAASAPVSASPKAVPAPPSGVTAGASADGVSIAWTLPEGTIKAITVLRGIDPVNLAEIATLPPSATDHMDATAQRGRSYYYAVRASNDIGESPPSQLVLVSLVDKPSAPQNVFAAPLQGEIRVTWQPPADTGGADPSAITYFVKRDGRIVATDIKVTTFLDRNRLPGQNHTYTVVAFNGLESDESASVRAAAKVIVNEPPLAAVAVLTALAKPNETVELDASQSADRDGVVIEYVWDYGDGSPTATTNIPTTTHVYKANGTYTVTLVVKDHRGAESRPATAQVLVGDPTDIQRESVEDLLTPPNASEVPGSTTGKLPIPAVPPMWVLLGVAAAVLAVRRKR